MPPKSTLEPNGFCQEVDAEAREGARLSPWLNSYHAFTLTDPAFLFRCDLLAVTHSLSK